MGETIGLTSIDGKSFNSFLMKIQFWLTLFLVSIDSFGQDPVYVSNVIEHEIHSEFLDESRSYWVSLPLHYSDSLEYPVIYVLDAEWRFDLVRHIAFEYGAWDKINRSIVVGIPHLEMHSKRGVDMTFNQSRIEYDGEKVDSTWYNPSNSGGGLHFYHFLTKELIPDINERYSSNNFETLIGHSYGGYFGAYILSMDHPFEVIHCYDPSIWYSEGEVIELFKKTNYSKKTRIHLTYQAEPEYHRKKIEEFIKVLNDNDALILSTEFYETESHNSLFLDSFYKGILKTNKAE